MKKLISVDEARAYALEHFPSPVVRRPIEEVLDKCPGVEVVTDINVGNKHVVLCKDCARSRPLRDREIGVFEPYCLICTCAHGCGVAYPEYDMDDKVVLPTSFCSYGYRLPKNEGDTP